jgi:integrase
MKSAESDTQPDEAPSGHISALSDFELMDLPVTFRGSTVVSRFRDSVWDFAHQMDRRNQYTMEARIDWSRPLINGVVLVNGEHKKLLIELKCAALSFLTRSRPTICRQPKPQTVFHSQWVHLRRFAAFITTMGLNSLRDVTPQHLCAYYRSLFDATSLAGSRIGTRINPVTMYQYASITNQLWAVRVDVGIPDMAEPWTERRLRQYYGVRKRLEPGTPIIPEPAIRVMLDLAFDLIDHRLSTVVRIQKLAYSINDRFKDHPGIREREVRAIYHRFGYTNGSDFQREQHLCRASCIAVILLFSGIRESELVSLQRNCYRPRHLDGMPAHGVLTGLRFKGREFPERCQWSVPTVVGTAVRGLMDLTALIWQDSTISPVNLSQLRKPATGETSADIVRTEGALLVTRHRKRRKGRATVMTGHVVRGDLQLLSIAAQCQNEDGDPWMLSCHQFRRTFAYLIARHQLGDVRYLRHHLGHADVETTIYYCTGALTDDVLTEEVAEERRKLQSALMDRWLDPKSPLSGGRGREIASRRIAINTIVDRKGLATLLGDHIRIRSTGHSYCTCQGQGCGGEGLYDAIRCANCSGAVINDEFLQVWEGLRDQQRDIVESGELGVGLQTRAAEQLAACESVIADLRNQNL